MLAMATSPTEVRIYYILFFGGYEMPILYDGW